MFNFSYLAHGTSTDYMHDIVKVPMAFTFEVSSTTKLQLLLMMFQSSKK